MKFLSEIYRILKPNGVFRASFPPIDTLLYIGYGYREFCILEEINVKRFGHIHFPAFEELEYIAKILGFINIKKCKYRKSEHPELSNLENRSEQQFTNYHVEFKKGNVKN